MGSVTGVLNLFCAVIAAVIWIFLRRIKLEARSSRIFMRLSLTISFMLLTDAVALLFLPVGSVMYRVCEACSFLLYSTVLAFYSVYIAEVLGANGRVFIIQKIIIFIFSGLLAVMWIGTCFNPFMFDITTRTIAENKFPYYFASFLTVIVMFSNLLILIIGSKAKFSRMAVVLSLFPILPLISHAVDKISPGLNSRYSLILVVAVINVFLIIIEIERRYTQQREKLEKYRLSSKLARIKPHYIYNVLTSISYLCEYDPKTAQNALGIFSDYLRGILGKMDERSVVTFAEEMDTVKKYISLEKLRFGNRFSIEYDFEVEKFSLPPFTLQPLVENSVKHGLADLDEPGKIVIKTYEDAYGYYVVVSDNGKGFDTEDEAMTGVGTQYIKDILALTVRGMLKIESTVGKGTVSTIFIPKEG